jgi:hypothetical protein
MPADRPTEPKKPEMKLARIREGYHKMPQVPDLTDREIDDMRQHVIRIARAICEHVWGKRFY